MGVQAQTRPPTALTSMQCAWEQWQIAFPPPLNGSTQYLRKSCSRTNHQPLTDDHYALLPVLHPQLLEVMVDDEIALCLSPQVRPHRACVAHSSRSHLPAWALRLRRTCVCRWLLAARQPNAFQVELAQKRPTLPSPTGHVFTGIQQRQPLRGHLQQHQPAVLGVRAAWVRCLGVHRMHRCVGCEP